MAKHFSKSTETKDVLLTTCNPQVMSRCLSMPDATSLHYCLKNKQLKLIMVSVVRIQVFSTVEEDVADTCILVTMPPISWKSTTLAG